MSVYDLLKAASEMTLTDEKISMLKHELKLADKKFEAESKKKLVNEEFLTKIYCV
ncbi:hypothetical protein [Pantoea agglomerans]|jgi:hypothetical protein|uniref:hypothetical protein n=1 Tax=Enterobacter agglomerans TaxID=549 RepID=UPI003C7AAD4D